MQNLNVAVIGAGYWGPNLVRNFSACQSTSVAAICDLDLAKAQKLADRFGSPKVTADVQELLADSAIEAVAIATPVHTHYPLAKRALQAGKHVLVEKPLTMSSQQGQELVDLAASKNLRLMCDHTFCYTGPVRKIRELVHSGELGEVLYFDSVRVNLGLFQSDVNVLWDLAPHDLSILDFILPDHIKPVAVSATGLDAMNTGFESIAYLTVHYDDSLIGHVHANWLSPVKVRMTLVGGTQKMVVWDDTSASERIKVYDKGVDVDESKREDLLVRYRHGGAHIPVLENTEALLLMVSEFADAIAQGRKPLTSGEDGLLVVKILEAANKSIAQGGA
ncbi:MAG TPA: oxidoreductase, partial [Myxococcales bacterium]|nr:oxidoreductase [Myxococcales bacterium]